MIITLILLLPSINNQISFKSAIHYFRENVLIQLFFVMPAENCNSSLNKIFILSKSVLINFVTLSCSSYCRIVLANRPYLDTFSKVTE